MEIKGDMETYKVVGYVLDFMGFKFLAKEAEKQKDNLDIFIKLIKYKKKQFPEIIDFINYFL